MPDEFVPLVLKSAKSPDTTFASVAKGASNGNGANGHDSPKGFSVSSPDDDGCGKPVVTLQRNGDVISGIRIQCPCGRVLELACVY